MNHKQKIQLARRLITPEEIKVRTPLFGSARWVLRGLQIQKRVKTEQDAAHARALKRKNAAKKLHN